MSKERLEEIFGKHNYIGGIGLTKNELIDKLLHDLRDSMHKESIQAERVAELEDKMKSHAPEGRNYTNKHYVDLLHENKRYREVLEESYAELRQLHSSLEVSGASSNVLGVLEYVGLTLIKQALDKIGGIEND